MLNEALGAKNEPVIIAGVNTSLLSKVVVLVLNEELSAIKLGPIIFPLALILPEAEISVNNTSSPLIEAITPVKWEPSPLYNPKEAVDNILELKSPDNVILLGTPKVPLANKEPVIVRSEKNVSSPGSPLFPWGPTFPWGPKDTTDTTLVDS